MRTQTIPVAAADAAERLAAALAGGASTVVLASRGGLADVLRLARAARAGGATEVLVESGAPGPLSEARALLAAGVTGARVVVGAADPAPLAAAAARLLDAGVAVEIRLPIAPGLPPAAARLRRVRSLEPRLAVFALAPERADPHAAAEAAGAVAEAAGSGAAVALAPEHPLPPCLVELAPAVRPLLADRLRAPGAANGADPACGRCALAPACTLSAAELARAGGGRAPSPLASADGWPRAVRRLTARDVERFFHVDYAFEGAGAPAVSRIGVTYRCNQRCVFCALAGAALDLSPEQVDAAIAAARARGSTRLILTGGEPTLSPRLGAHVARARALGFEEIELQTNAVLLDRPGAAAALVEAGLGSAQVSLHAADAGVSDALTGAPGTHARTLAGIDRLLEAGARVVLNHLVFRGNAHLLEAAVDLAASRWGGRRDRLALQLHLPRDEFGSREEALRHVPRYRDVAAPLRRAVDRARAAGLAVADLQDPTGIPSLCVLDADERYLGPIRPQATRPRAHAEERAGFTRVPACGACAVAAACLGVPRSYVELYGDEEFHAVPGSAACSASS